MTSLSASSGSAISSRASTTLAFFSFLGSIVFSRERWEEIGLEERFVGSLFAHVARLFAMIAQGATFDYLPDSYVFTRGENDSFMDRGIVNRYAKVIDGYHDLAAAYFGADSAEAAHVRRVVRAEFPLWLAFDLRRAAEREGPNSWPSWSITRRAFGEPAHATGSTASSTTTPRIAGSWRHASRCARCAPLEPRSVDRGPPASSS